MSRVLVIGCGGVASVAIQKCCQVDEVFTEMCIASRTKEKCDALVEKLKGKTKTVLTTAKVDADDVDQLIELINSYKPDLVMNIALPYQDLTIMDACLACGVNYMDTANYELLDLLGTFLFPHLGYGHHQLDRNSWMKARAHPKKYG